MSWSAAEAKLARRISIKSRSGHNYYKWRERFSSFGLKNDLVDKIQGRSNISKFLVPSYRACDIHDNVLLQVQYIHRATHEPVTTVGTVHCRTLQPVYDYGLDCTRRPLISGITPHFTTTVYLLSLTATGLPPPASSIRDSISCFPLDVSSWTKGDVLIGLDCFMSERYSLA